MAKTAPQGTDTVRATALDYTFVANVEHLVLTGNAVNGTGKTLASSITGNAQNNYLGGEGGNDLLNGGSGASEFDRLHGGANADTFVLGDAGVRFSDDGSPATPGLNDYAIIEDFTPSHSDKLRLAGSAAQYFLGAFPVPGVLGVALLPRLQRQRRARPGQRRAHRHPRLAGNPHRREPHLQLHLPAAG